LDALSRATPCYWTSALIEGTGWPGSRRPCRPQDSPDPNRAATGRGVRRGPERHADALEAWTGNRGVTEALIAPERPAWPHLDRV
jgi:hypothetical protein